MYEHPQIFGAREYFLTDTEFHDDCLGIDNSYDDVEDGYVAPSPISEPKITKTRKPSPEPRKGVGASEKVAPARLVVYKPGRPASNPPICRSGPIWADLGPNSHPAPATGRGGTQASGAQEGCGEVVRAREGRAERDRDTVLLAANGAFCIIIKNLWYHKA